MGECRAPAPKLAKACEKKTSNNNLYNEKQRNIQWKTDNFPRLKLGFLQKPCTFFFCPRIKNSITANFDRLCVCWSRRVANKNIFNWKKKKKLWLVICFSLTYFNWKYKQLIFMNCCCWIVIMDSFLVITLKRGRPVEKKSYCAFEIFSSKRKTLLLLLWF